MSLSVQYLAASRSFYERIGFKVAYAEQDQNWLILGNGGIKIDQSNRKIVVFPPNYGPNFGATIFL